MKKIKHDKTEHIQSTLRKRQKNLFDIDQVIAKLTFFVTTLPQAALFELFSIGHQSPFEQLIACLISVRTYDEISLPAALNLFKIGRTPEEIAKIDIKIIKHVIKNCTFSETKSRRIHSIAKLLSEKYNNMLPCNPELILSLPGIGPKCTNLVMGIACNVPRVSVDTHVHRVTNRWGYVATASPEQTMLELEAKLPRKYWVEINRLLVPFGKHICTRITPYCTRCPVEEWCQQKGVLNFK